MTQLSLSLKDSTLFGDEPFEKSYQTGATSCMVAIDELQRQFSEGKIKLLSLSQYHVQNDTECPIWYKIDSTTIKNGKEVPDRTLFYSSHYIGYCNIKGVPITIRPRFGEALQNYLLNYACNLYIPQGETGYNSTSEQEQGFLLIALLWKAMLEKAISFGQIPKQYIQKSERIPTFRGHLNIAKHIRTSLVDASKFFCTYRKLTLDNVINQTIRYTYFLLSKQNSGISAAIRGISEYDNKLAIFGVNNSPVGLNDIDKICYTKLNYIYKPVMSFSRAIIAHREAAQNPNLSNVEFAYFIDMAEIWELYLLKLLQQNLDEEYSVFSPNAGYGDYLLEGGYREVRPDIMIKRNDQIVMIIDAKYKKYQSFGKTAEYGISREDLYQMNTYLYCYGKGNEPIIGLFVSPVSNLVEDDIHTFKHNQKHHIGLLNLDLQGADKDISKLHEEEKRFIGNIKELLSGKKFNNISDVEW